MRRLPTAGFVAGWATGGILLTVSLEFGTRLPYILATTVLIVALVVRNAQIKREITRTLTGEDHPR